VVVLRSLLVILLLLEESQMCPVCELRPFPVLALGDHVLEC
jgi:hypothetical protein